MRSRNKNRTAKLIKSKIPTVPIKDTCKKKIMPVLPFHKTFPYGISWEVKISVKIVDTYFAYFSYEDHRDAYIKKYLKGIKKVKKFKTKVRKDND